jgi:antitoxin component of MazEF toxin-antitoxin module
MGKIYFNFGNRKVQKVRYSYLIPLPPEWIKSMGIEHGNSVEIGMQDDKSLRITPVPVTRQDEKRTEVPTTA